MKYYFGLLFLSIALFSNAQFFIGGQNQPSKKWRQINTEDFQLIYPEEFEQQAQRTANILDTIAEKATKTLDVKPKKISIIIQNDLMDANGFVTLAPWRSEFYTTPPQFDDGLDWVKGLAIHEYRHVVQISKFKQGLTKVLYYMFGEQAIGIVIGATTPLWWFEGDAVGFETFSTNYGNGRLPSFNMEMRTQVLELGAFNYNKASFGSYKHFVPNRYRLGYNLTSYAKQQYGSQTWDRVINRVARFPLRPFPFSSAVKKETGCNTNGLYEEMINYMSRDWQSQLNRNRDNYSAFEILSEENEIYTNYKFPQYTSYGIACVKQGYDDIDQVVLINEDGVEQKVASMGRYDRATFKANKRYAVWSEEIPNPRWGYLSYSDVVVLDLESGQRKRVSKKQRLLAPDISSDNRIVAVKVDNKNQFSLKVINLKGESLISIKLPQFLQIFHPVWNEVNSAIYFAAKTSKGQSVWKWDLYSERLEKVFGDANYLITQLYQKNGKLFFNSTENGIDNIFSFELENGRFYQETVSRFGAFNCTMDTAGVLIYNEYTSSGYKVVKRKGEEVNQEPMYISQSLIMFTNALINESKITVNEKRFKTYESEAYKKWKHLFNFHSWGPLSVNASSQDASLGFSVMSQNKLSTSIANINYTFDASRSEDEFEISYAYLGWYPELKLTNSISRIFNVPFVDENEIKFATQKVASSIFEMEVNLDYTRNHFNKRAFASLGYSINKIQVEGNQEEGLLIDGNLDFANAIVGFSSVRKKSKREILPRYGFDLTAMFRNSILSTDFTTGTLLGSSKLYFPGLYKNHGLSVDLGYQNSIAKGLQFTNSISLPTGFFDKRYQQIHSAKTEYHFPVLYPDLNLGKLGYIQRIKSAFHYDIAEVKLEETGFELLQSAGFEVTFDSNWLRYSFPIEIGAGYFVPLNNLSDQYIQFIFNISFL